MLDVRKKNLPKTSIRFYSSSAGISIDTETPRLYIRSYDDEDFNNCLTLYGDPAVTKYFDHGQPRSRAEIEKYIQGRGRKYFKNNQPFGIFSVFSKKDRIFMGQVDLVPGEQPGEVEIGWIFHKDFQGKGYCTEAVQHFLLVLVNELVSKGFQANGSVIDKVMATAHPDNRASNRVIEKAGMTFDKFQERYGGKPRLWYSYTP